MITVRRAEERHHDRLLRREVWHTFHPRDRADPLADGFGNLEFLVEERLPPGAAVPRQPPHDAEIVTYVHEGALTYDDSKGGSGVIQAGDFHRMTAAHGIRHGEANASRTEWAHVFRIWLRPSEAGQDQGYEQKHFTLAERRDGLCVVASPDARRGSLRIHQDTVLYSALLHPGQHVAHELSKGRSAWLHVVQGQVVLCDIVLTAGDGAGVTGERAVSFTAREDATILFLDVGERLPALPGVRSGRRSPARMPGRPSGGDASAEASGTAVFRTLWDELVDVLGTAASAAILGRAARRALPRSAELGKLAIVRLDQEYGYVVPRSFDRTLGPRVPLRDLLDELRPLLVELTGRVVLRRLERVPELREWATFASSRRI